MAKASTDTESVLKLVINGEQAKSSVNDLRNTYYKLNAEINNMKKSDNPQVYAEKVQQIQKIEAAWKAARQEIRAASDEAKGFKTDLVDLAKTSAGNLVLAGAMYAVGNGAKNMIQKNAELSDSMGGVMKTTGLNEDAVDRLNEKFKQMDTRTASTQLLELAQVAGKLGYSAEKDVEGFVRAADQIGVALGEDLGGVEAAVNSLGKLVNIFKISDQFELEESLLKVGSAINTLGASGTANEKNLIDFSQRLAGVAPAANMSLPTVLAYGAVMDELGQSMESSSTAIGQFIVELGADVPKFAKIAGMSIQDFSKLLREDASEAFLRVLEKSKTAGGGIQALATNMGILEVSGAKGVSSLGAMADNIDLVRSRLATSNQAFDDGTSILAEFDTMNNNLAANLEKLWNKLNQLWESSAVRKSLTSLTSATIDFVDWLYVTGDSVEEVSKSYLDQKSATEALEAQAENLTKRYMELSSQSSLNKTGQEELRGVIDKLAALLPQAVTEWDQYGNAIDISTQKVKSLTKAQRDLFEAREGDNIKDMQNQFKASQYMAKVYQDQANSANKNLQTGNLSRASKWLGLDEKDVKVGIKQSTLEMGKAYDAAVALRDVYKQSLTKEQQEVINHFNGISTAAGNANKKIAPGNTDSSTTKSSPAKAKKSSKKSEKDKALEEQKREEEQAKRHFEQLLKDEGLFAANQVISLKSKYEKELSLEAQKYDKQIAGWEAFKTKKGVSQNQLAEADLKIQELQIGRGTAVSNLKLKQEQELVDSISKLREELVVKNSSELDKEASRINEHYDKLKSDFVGNATAQEQVEVDRAIDLTNAKIREEERLAAEMDKMRLQNKAIGLTDHQKKITELDVQYNEELFKLREKFSQELMETELFHEALDLLNEEYRLKKEEVDKESDKKTSEDKLNAALDAAQSISDAVFSIMGSNLQAESDARVSALQKQKDKELSNKNLTEKQKAAITEKYDKQIAAEKLRAWKSQKKADILSATINTALAVTKSLPNWIMAAAAGIAGAAQIAVIAAQKPPQFERGGMLPSGSRHTQGGINLVDSRSSKLVGNIEGGEPILSRKTYANNREIVDALLYNSQRKNGSRIALRPDLIHVENENKKSNIPIPAPVVNVPAADNGEVVALLRRLVDIGNKPSTTILSTRLLADHQDDMAKLEDSVNG